MARFQGTAQGSRGEVSRLGGKNGGITTRANGWNVGIKVYGQVDENDNDVFVVYLTGGSTGAHYPILIGKFTAEDLKKGAK